MNVAVVGTGLIGTSVALAAARAGDRVRGFDADPGVLGTAARLAGLEASASVEACAAGSDLVLVSTPLGAIVEAVARSLETSGGAPVTDVGSVKGTVVREVARRVPSEEGGGRFVGGHPMSGSERAGPEAASAALLDDAVWVLTPGTGTEPSAVEAVEGWVGRIGARPVRMEPERHDRLVAFVSHLPQLASTALMAVASEEEADEPELLLLAAGGFRDLTRLAGSSPPLWRDILLANPDALARAVDRYVDRLRLLRDAVLAGRAEEVEAALGSAKRARLGLAAKPAVKAGVALLLVPVPDRPGVLAELTATLGGRSVNIEDLQIVHSPEGGRGTVHLTVAAADAALAGEALAARGFESVRLA
jgi:prephenate dehydrogenase